MKKFIIILIIAHLFAALGFSQTVSNVSVSQEGKMIVVSYDIDKASSVVQLTVSTDGGKTFSSPLKKVSGDVANVKPGHCKIVWDVLSEMESFCGDNIVFDVIVGENWVDLGLSVKWGTCNLGASRPEEYGNYYTWGDIADQIVDGKRKPDVGFNNNNFNSNPSYMLNYSSLKAEYDSAHMTLGGRWRMPTELECQELIDNCISSWTKVNGVKGRLFTSKKPGYTDKSIFLPAAGYYDIDGRLINAKSCGYYWSSSISSTYHSFGTTAWCLRFFRSDHAFKFESRIQTFFSIRPVVEE